MAFSQEGVSNMDIPIIERTLTHLSASFDEFGIPYYLTGSLAVQVYGKQGPSQKIEVVANIKLSQVSALVAWLEKQYAVKEVHVRDAIQQRSSFDLVHHDTLQRLTVLLPAYRAYSQAQQERVQLHSLEPGGRPFCLVAPEDVILTLLERYKMSGQRAQRLWKDIQVILEVQGSRLDLTHLRLWATSLDIARLLETALVVARLSHAE
jgi:hypothetical protein